MNKHAKLFLLVVLAAGVAHFLIVQGLTVVVDSKSGGASLILVPALWVLRAHELLVVVILRSHTVTRAISSPVRWQ